MALVLVTGGASGDGHTPIEITLLGPGPARVRVARGTTFPCDSGDNRHLIEQRLEPGQTVRAAVPEHCVCLQQTFAPFIDIDWSESSLVCRPQLCRGVGRARRCIPTPDPTIRLELRSTRRRK